MPGDPAGEADGLSASRRRLDVELVRRGLSETRSAAQQLIAAGSVLVGGSLAERAARLVAPGEAVEVLAPTRRYVGRGGHKLEGALDRFELDPGGVRALDAGASTGGFTDCLLQRGASWVLALDVGRAQLHSRLAGDPRVCSRERCDVRDLRVQDVDGGPLDLVVADLSFISLRSVASALVSLTAPGGDLVVLVKPQFECGRRAAAACKGVVRDPDLWAEALVAADRSFAAGGAAIMGAMVSPLLGSAGNVEFFLHARAPGPASAGEPSRTSERARATCVEELVRQAGALVARSGPAAAGTLTSEAGVS